MQYVQILNIVDTSIKRAISGQSTPMAKGCTHGQMLDMVDNILFCFVLVFFFFLCVCVFWVFFEIN